MPGWPPTPRSIRRGATTCTPDVANRRPPAGVDGAFGRAYEPDADHPLLIPSAGINGAAWDLADLCAAAALARPGRPAVLTFHGVPDHHPWCNTDPGLFRRFLAYLAANDYTVIALRDLARYVDPERRPADPYAAVAARVFPEARELSCEYAPDPLAVQCARPRLRWTLAGARRDQWQTAYQVVVASRPELLRPGRADRWDSGKVSARSGAAVTYAGQPLGSGETCYWSVRCWDGADRAGPWAAPARFELGLLEAEAWGGSWIGDSTGISAPLLRRGFEVAGAVRRARLYAAGLGFAELYVNGVRLGDAVLDPAPTDYDKRVLYVTHDVTALLRNGANVPTGAWRRRFAPPSTGAGLTPRAGGVRWRLADRQRVRAGARHRARGPGRRGAGGVGRRGRAARRAAAYRQHRHHLSDRRARRPRAGRPAAPRRHAT